MENSPGLPPHPSSRDKRTLSPHSGPLASTIFRPFDVPNRGGYFIVLPLAGMEACWMSAIIIGLANINFLQVNGPLIPLWAPFLLLPTSAWLIRFLTAFDINETGQNDEIHTPASPFLVYIFLSCTTLFLIWFSFYKSFAFFLDPRWFLFLLNDVFLLSPTAYRLFVLLLVTTYLIWRSVRIAHTNIEPAYVFRMLRLGMVIILAILVIQAGTHSQNVFDQLLLILVPLFLILALITHTLSHHIFTHISHSDQSLDEGRGSLFVMLASVCALLLCGSLVIAAFINPTFLAKLQQLLAPMGQVYDWIVNILATFIALVASPIFWLVSLFHPTHATVISPRQIKHPTYTNKKPASPPAAIETTALALKFLIPLFLIGVICFLVIRSLQRRKRIVHNRATRISYESLWSWELFLNQLRLFFSTLWFYFFRPVASTPDEQTYSEDGNYTPAARTIREIYRTLLTWAAEHGIIRTLDETPYEFRKRLAKQLPQTEPQLGILTDTYVTARYGGILPDESEVVYAQETWQALRDKVQANSNQEKRGRSD